MVAGDYYETNPRFELTDGAREMLTIWMLFRSELGGVGHLPEAGGTVNQAAIMVDALRYMNQIHHEMTHVDESEAGATGRPEKDA